MMKKFFVSVLIIALAVTSVSLTGCKKTEKKDYTPEIKEKIAVKVDAYMTDFMDSAATLDTNDKIREHLINWGSSKGLRTKDDNGIIVMSVDGSEAYKDVPPTIIICPYDAEQFDSCANPIILTLYTLKNNEDTGKLAALFVPEEAHDFSKVNDIKKKYLPKNARVICLNGNVNGHIANACGGESSYEFTSKLKQGKPRYKKAYKIAMRGLTSTQPDNKINSAYNPVLEINSFLAGLKNASIDYEIADFDGGDMNLLSPGSAYIKLTIDENKQEKFLKRLNSKVESFQKAVGTKNKEARMVYKEISVPGKVIKQDDSSKLVSFIYTLLKGEYQRDEETDSLIAVADVVYIKAKGKKARIGSVACSLDSNKLKELDEAEETLCGLSGFKFKKMSEVPVWEAKENSELLDKVVRAYSSYTGKELKTQASVTPTNANYVARLKDDLDIISMTVSDNILKDMTGTVISYLMDSNTEPQEE